MKKVLIVDDEKLFLVSLTEGLSSYSNEFEVLIANNGKQAIDVLTSQSIDVMVTDLNMPIMDGFELLAYCISHYPKLLIIVMTAFGTPNIENQLQGFGIIGYLEKPIDFQLLTDKIRLALAQTTKGRITGIALFSFLQLLEREKKTCLLRIVSSRREGFLYFFAGELVNALYEESEGDEAAYEIVCWENVDIEIKEMAKKVDRLISAPLSNLLVEATRFKNEGGKRESGPKKDPLSISEQGAIAGKLINNSIFNEKSNKPQKEIVMGNVNDCLTELMKVDGAMAASVVDAKSGMSLGSTGNSNINLDVAAAGNSEVMRAKLKTMQNLGLKDRIEDILISLGQQYHLIRPLAVSPQLFIYFVLNRAQSNLAMARHKLSEIEGRLEI